MYLGVCGLATMRSPFRRYLCKVSHRAPEPQQFKGWPGHPVASWLLGNASDSKGSLSRLVLFTAIPVIAFSSVVGFLHGSGLHHYEGPAWNGYLLLGASAVLVLDRLTWTIRLRRYKRSSESRAE